MIRNVCLPRALSGALTLLWLLWYGRAAALNPNVPIGQLQHTTWDARDIAPLSSIIVLAQTADGYLWLATAIGLYRFDGLVFERVELPHDPRVNSLRLYTLFVDRDDGLWVSFVFGGVARRHQGRWQTYTSEDGLPPGSPNSFAQAPDGSLWVTTTAGVARFDGAHWLQVGTQQGLPATLDHNHVFVDGQGAIWLSTRKGIFTRRHGESLFHPISYVPQIEGGFVESSTGIVWRQEGTQLMPIAQNPPPRMLQRQSNDGAPVIDFDGEIWTASGRLLRFTPPTPVTLGVPFLYKNVKDVYSSEDGLPPYSAKARLVDHEGNVWIASTRGLSRFSEPRVTDPLQLSANRRIWSEARVPTVGIAPTADGDGLWVTNYYGVYLYKDGLLTLAHSGWVGCIFRGDDGTVWFGGPDGLWRMRTPNRFESVTLPTSDMEVQAIAVDGAGRLWTSIVRAGVFRLQEGVWTAAGGIRGLPAGPALTIVRDHANRLWFSYPGGIIAVVDGDRVRTYGSSDGLSIGNVLANLPGHTEEWLGGDLGLARFDGKRFQTVLAMPDVPTMGITGIIESTGGDLWFNTPAGIVHIKASELARSRSDPSYPVRGEMIDTSNGLVGSASEIRPLPSVAETADGKLWFTTRPGFYGVDPGHLVRNREPPPVLIRALVVNDHLFDPRPGVELPVRTTAVRFDFVAVSLTAPEKVRYRYRLDGVDREWGPLTASRQALYTNLSPGSYTFRVIGANNDGVWNERGAALSFFIPPAFTQTRAFLLLCVAATLLMISALVRLRVRQVSDRVRLGLEERMAERERIARDLHDTLLQSFQGLLLQFQTSYKLLPGRPTEAKQSLEVAIDGAFQAITEGRDAVQGLRVATVGSNDLAATIKTLAQELAGTGSGKAVEVQVEVTGTPQPLQPLTRDEVYRIAGESLRNAFRHSGATRIEVDLCYDRQQLRLRVRDDGRGIDPHILRAEGRPGHYGIPGMRERARLMGAALALWTAPNSGTEIELSVPASRAYVPLLGARRAGWLTKFFSPRPPIEP